MELLMKSLSKIRVPSQSQAIYKDECVFSYDNPESPTGLYVNLTTFLGFGEDYVEHYTEKTGNCVYLHMRREKHLKQKDADEKKETGELTGPERKITRLAIGVEGGYNDDTDKYEYKDVYSIVVLPEKDKKIPYPNKDLPAIVTQAVDKLLAQESAITKLEKLTVTGTWDGEVRRPSIYSEILKQLNNEKKIPPYGWKCEKCDLTTNLWLNLSDGSILCGRRFFNGSGGNEHAVEHYKEKGYPLAVKLGTISADGKADVFSYPEDDMVIDTKLNEHLAHFGINVNAMKKSEKSMVELELDLNQRIGEWSLLCESGTELKPLSGPGYTGMRNLGNSCYINSVMQVLFTIPDFKKRFVEGASKYLNEIPSDPANDFDIQMAKLGIGLCSGKYSNMSEDALASESNGISPAMFKSVIGRNHQDFSTKQQQDAYDFYLYLANLCERHSVNQLNPMDALSFCVEDRVECMSSKRVKYTRRHEYCLPLVIPLDKATNLHEVEDYLRNKTQLSKCCPAATANMGDDEPIRHKITFQACLDTYFAPEIIENFHSTAINGMTTATKTTRLATMPDFLMMHLRKFTLGDDWSPKKLNVSIEMPDKLDLTKWRGSGQQKGEELLPDITFEFNETIINELLQMGFPCEACKRAVYHTKNMGVEAASNWLMEHICDANISDPFILPANENAMGEMFLKSMSYSPDAESLAMLMSMGFDINDATKALQATDGNIERATDWIFSHSSAMNDDHDKVTQKVSFSNDDNNKSYRDGVGKYNLVAFISHMGTSAQVGHYVCHIRKNDEWVIFNDNKVALSQNPPKDLGYLYLYKRAD